MVQHHHNATAVNFTITSTKLYVPIDTLPVNDENIKFLEHLNQGFKRTISWNKYRSEITTKLKNNNLDYMIDPTFRNINRLFVQLLKMLNNDAAINCFKYYMLLVEIKDFNAFSSNLKKTNKSMKNLLECQETVTIQHGAY